MKKALRAMDPREEDSHMYVEEGGEDESEIDYTHHFHGANEGLEMRSKSVRCRTDMKRKQVKKYGDQQRFSLYVTMKVKHQG